MQHAESVTEEECKTKTLHCVKVQYEKSATWTNSNRRKLQHGKSATGEEFKTKILQRVKVQHEIVKYIKRLLHKKLQHGNVVVWKKCQHEKI